MSEIGRWGEFNLDGVLGSSGDANNMWEKTTNCTKKATRVLGASTGNFGGHRGVGGRMLKIKTKWKQRRLLMICWFWK